MEGISDYPLKIDSIYLLFSSPNYPNSRKIDYDYYGITKITASKKDSDRKQSQKTEPIEDKTVAINAVGRGSRSVQKTVLPTILATGENLHLESFSFSTVNYMLGKTVSVSFESKDGLIDVSVDKRLSRKKQKILHSWLENLPARPTIHDGAVIVFERKPKKTAKTQ